MGEDHAGPGVVRKDGRDWRVGAEADVGWIRSATTVGSTVAAAVPPHLEAFCTILVPDQDQGRAADLHLLLGLLRARSSDQPWWLGYLETGADDLVFPEAPRVTLYQGWPYVLVQAGPQRAGEWRQDLRSWRAPGPDLIFPADRSWLVSWLWDDDWRCVGGPADLVDAILADPDLRSRRVEPDQDATPPGHEVR